jgi:hypothetical protein
MPAALISRTPTALSADFLVLAILDIYDLISCFENRDLPTAFSKDFVALTIVDVRASSSQSPPSKTPSASMKCSHLVQST